MAEVVTMMCRSFSSSTRADLLSVFWLDMKASFSVERKAIQYDIKPVSAMEKTVSSRTEIHNLRRSESR
jgi:hypothetical protein